MFADDHNIWQKSFFDAWEKMQLNGYKIENLDEAPKNGQLLAPFMPSDFGCGSPQWKGDDYCDDDNNNSGCDWDGGDCCGDNVNKSYCVVCQCLNQKQ